MDGHLVADGVFDLNGFDGPTAFREYLERLRLCYRLRGWDHTAIRRDVLAHAHAMGWIGKYRFADLVRSTRTVFIWPVAQSE
jgi:hypothetical protein